MAMKGTLTWLLAIVLLSVTVTGVLADVEVNSISCAVDGDGMCTTGALITINGDNLHDLDGVFIGSNKEVQRGITCTMTDNGENDKNKRTRVCQLEMDYFPGIYAMTGYDMDDDGTYDHIYPMGSLALGIMTGFSPSGFTNAWSKATPPAGEVVTGFNTTLLASFEKWAIFGNFTPSSEYRVWFYSDEDTGMPTCGNDETLIPTPYMTQKDSNYANAIVCTIRSRPGNMGMYTLLVQDVKTGAFLPGTTELSQVTVQPSLPTVTAGEGSCAENSVNCINGATLTLVGERFNTRGKEYNRIVFRNAPEVTATSGISCTVEDVTDEKLTCTLSIPSPSDVIYGSFGVYAQVALCSHSMWSTEKFLGNLIYGTYSGQTYQGFTTEGVDLIAGQQVALGTSDAAVHTGGTFTVYGRFDPAHTMRMDFYNTQDDGTGVPTCSGTTVTLFSVTCNSVTQALGNLGMYRAMIKDVTGNYFIPTVTTRADPIMVYAPLPTVTDVTGACAASSSECKTGATLTLEGSNFVVDKTNEVVFTQDGLSCAVAAVTSSNTLTCTLTVASNVPQGEYPMYVRAQACAKGMKTPDQAAGYLLIGQKSSMKGWSPTSVNGACETSNGGDASSNGTGGDADSDDKDDNDDHRGPGGNPAAVAFAVIFGIITLAFIIVSIVLCCCCTLTRKRKVSANYHPDTMSDRYWNADRAMEMNEQGRLGEAPQQAFGTAVGAPVATAMGAGMMGAGMAGAAKAPAPMPEDTTDVPQTQVRELERPPISASDSSKAQEVAKKYNDLGY